MFFKFDDLGEKTINKIAEIALSTKLEKRDKLAVKVKTDPNLLAKGTLESLVIDCQGLMVENALRMESINITLNTIAVSPFKALAGNIQLTQPSRGKACVLLTEKDITRVLEQAIFRKIQNEIVINEQVVKVSLQQVKCSLLETGKILIQGTVKLEDTKSNKRVSLEIKPKICQGGQGVIIDDIEYLEEPSLSSILLNPILKEAQSILNLKNFKVDGFSLKVEQFNIKQGALQLQAEAGMTHFPQF